MVVSSSIIDGSGSSFVRTHHGRDGNASALPDKYQGNDRAGGIRRAAGGGGIRASVSQQDKQQKQQQHRTLQNPTLQKVGFDGNCDPGFTEPCYPLGNCQGDCDSNDDCEVSIIQYKACKDFSAAQCHPAYYIYKQYIDAFSFLSCHDRHTIPSITTG